jgi:hypothetical protein
MYFHSDDLPKLHWEAMEDLPEMDQEINTKLTEAVRDRSGDTQPQTSQTTPTPKQPTEEHAIEAVPTKEGEGTMLRRSKRLNKQIPKKLNEYILIAMIEEAANVTG